jgi:hypothetical protein
MTRFQASCVTSAIAHDITAREAGDAAIMAVLSAKRMGGAFEANSRPSPGRPA